MAVMIKLLLLCADLVVAVKFTMVRKYFLDFGIIYMAKKMYYIAVNE